MKFSLATATAAATAALVALSGSQVSALPPMTFSSLARYSRDMVLRCISSDSKLIDSVIYRNPVNNNLHVTYDNKDCYIVYVSNVGCCKWDGVTLQYQIGAGNILYGYGHRSDLNLNNQFPIPPDTRVLKPSSSNSWHEDPKIQCIDDGKIAGAATHGEHGQVVFKMDD
ncbi:hypothetical protein GQ42DRAFT_161877 [Ramicandelaber brevisporus]|nr:hypothetical protein GQ42DRAFT_161877 [Ramicandelaber brevisporus]